LTFISYGCEKSASNAGFFLWYLCSHLRTIGVDFSRVEWQTDNSSEFIGAWNRKQGQTPFETVAKAFGSKTITIPPGRSTYNSDVEAMHRLIEDEFYDLEDYSNLTNFLSKAFTYICYFNYFRIFRYKDGKSPIDVLKECQIANINIKKVGLLKPIILDSLVQYLNFKDGYHLPKANIFIQTLHCHLSSLFLFFRLVVN